MESSVPHRVPGENSEPPVPRRRLLQMALAVTAGGGLQSLASADARAATPDPGAGATPRESSTSHRTEIDSPMKDAINACLDCHSMCLRTAMSYCLAQGGPHVEQQHFRMMLNCAELCQTSANFMLSDSPLHRRVCAVCAEACEACAESCKQVGGMDNCIEECLRCAKSCKTMA